jgi:putative DNA methylase
MTTTNHLVISPKKLIEVALPLDAINAAAKREKSIKHGHPSTLHLWWARRPLAAARAVIFGQLVHDPEDLWRCQNPGKEPVPQNKAAWTKARTRLFKIIEDLVLWENTTNETVLNAAREAIRESWRQTCELNKGHPQAAELFNPNKMPGLHDPFAGGGAIPLEAQRLGLEAYASDLNPVAVLINKAMIEIPPKFAGRPPVHPAARKSKQLIAPEWKGAAGLAEDVRRYGQWMRDEAEKRIGHLYPKVTITKEMVAERPDLKPLLGEELTVIAWLWARTVKSPNPAFAHVDVPLASSFILSSKKGKEAFVQPLIEQGGYRFAVKVGEPPKEARDGTVSRAGGVCLMSKVPMAFKYLREQAKAGKFGQRLFAIVAEGRSGRVYLSPSSDHERIARSATPERFADTLICHWPGRTNVVEYGMTKFLDLFTPRQLVALTTFSDLVGEARDLIRRDAIAAGLPDDDVSLEEGGTGAQAYADAVALYLGFAVDKMTDRNSSICGWDSSRDSIRGVFGRQAIPMVWDYAESVAIGRSAGSFVNALDQCFRVLAELPVKGSGISRQCDANIQAISSAKFVSTDPPYYDNIGYADLSDFFYVWLRRSLKAVFPSLFSTIAVPKAEELVATPYRHSSRKHAEAFFLDGMTKVMDTLAKQAHPSTPVTIYYAFKQSDTGKEGTSSAGWETFLAAVLGAGFSLTGTWPMETELPTKIGVVAGAGAGMLASSIILVCRPRAKDAGTISRRQFVRILNESLPLALDAMTRAGEGEHSPVAPVDLSQAIIGPGMAIFSRYDAVLEADGSPMSVKTALQLINRFLAGDDFDADTQFCLSWFEQHGWEAGKFGEADMLARAKGTSVDGVKQAGVAESGGGSVRLLRWKEYAADWDPSSDMRLPVWEALHQLIRAYNTMGDAGAAKVLAQTASKAEAMRQLAYRLYTLCERKSWADDARAYNEVVTGWTGIEMAASKESAAVQAQLFEN